MIWLKLLHLATIALWAAGLVGVPLLYLQRLHPSPGRSVQRLHHMARFLYVAVISPAAFLAIASGTALIFARRPLEAWFSFKLAWVGLMVVLHVIVGIFVIRLFGERSPYPFWRFLALATLCSATVAAILVLVLAKPELPQLLPQWASEPGGLRRFALNLFRR